ncbi:MAG: hypothetical protein ACI4F7_02570 [Acutalibacteraceae bacterium]
MKKAFAIFVCFFVICGAWLPASAAGSSVPYDNYTYSENDGSVILNPQAYLPETVIYGDDLSVGNFKNPTDFDVDENGYIYILDEGNNRVVVIGSNYAIKGTFECNSVEADGSLKPLNDASGINVSEKYVYISDTENNRVLLFDKISGEYVKPYYVTGSSVLGEDFIFKPTKTATDSEGNLYVVSNGTYEGLLNIKENGEFLSFFASNKVTASTWTLFWRRFSTKQQRKNSEQLIPQQFSSIDMDADGFYYITTYTAVSNSMVKRMNPGGNNVIRSLSNINLIGDPTKYYDGSFSGESSFSDVSAGPYKIYACLDKTRGKVFCYNYDGYLLYTFGTLSAQDGGFSSPVAISYLSDERIAVLDSTRGSLTVFSPTEYAKEINLGTHFQNELEYDEALKHWSKVLGFNSNYELALNMMGKSYYGSGDYDKALKYFMASNNNEMYSDTKKAMRSEWIYAHQWIFVVLVVLIIVWIVIKSIFSLFKRFKKKKIKRIG